VNLRLVAEELIGVAGKADVAKAPGSHAVKVGRNGPVPRVKTRGESAGRTIARDVPTGRVLTSLAVQVAPAVNSAGGATHAHREVSRVAEAMHGQRDPRADARSGAPTLDPPVMTLVMTPVTTLVMTPVATLGVDHRFRSPSFRMRHSRRS
jgi:hypothetical protein